ncbi:MAG: hypothetical protein PHQ98_02720, partial [Candidatus ainarchaeum sp.]|nr:hypothetical protein [Candidatus ainarchaeum sp.]
SKIKHPAIFWLDAHYSGGNTAKGKQNSPILQELNLIFKSKLNHIILIDDANYFGTKGYPTIEVVTKLTNNKKYNIKIEENIIQIIPKLYN